MIQCNYIESSKIYYQLYLTIKYTIYKTIQKYKVNITIYLLQYLNKLKIAILDGIKLSNLYHLKYIIVKKHKPGQYSMLQARNVYPVLFIYTVNVNLMFD